MVLLTGLGERSGLESGRWGWHRSSLRPCFDPKGDLDQREDHKKIVLGCKTQSAEAELSLSIRNFLDWKPVVTTAVVKATVK